MNTFRVLYLGLLLALSACNDQSNTRLDRATEPKTTSKIDSINQLIKSDPNNAKLYYERAKMSYADKDLPASIADMGRALKLDTTSAEFLIFMADIKLINKETRSALDFLQFAAKHNPEDKEVMIKLGEFFMLVEEYNQSFDYLNKALKIDVYDYRPYQLKGFNYKFLKDTLNAVSSFQTAVEQNPDDYDSYMQLGLLYAAENHPLAKDYFENALRVNPKSIEALYALGYHLQNTGKPREALEQYATIKELSPDFFLAHFNTGYVYLELIGAYDTAIQAYTQAIEFMPDNYFDAYYNRGLAYERKGVMTKALADYRKALEINPQYDLAALGISRIEERN